MSVTGSLKFDSLEFPELGGQSDAGARTTDRGRNRVLRYFRISPGRPVVIAASTLKGEEDPVLEAFLRIRASMPQRAARHRAAQARALRRGRAPGPRAPATPSPAASELRVDAEPREHVVVLDTIGELAQLFQIATVVFVGGSLVDAGGHNILEPAVFGKPIVFGPHMQNFAEIARTFLDNGAAIQIARRARARAGADRAARRSGAPREPRRRRSGAGRGQSRRPRTSLAVLAELLPPRTVRRRAPLPRGALTAHGCADADGRSAPMAAGRCRIAGSVGLTT